MSVRGVLLDVDDTLVDTRGAFRHAWSQLTERFLPHVGDVEEVVRAWRADDGGFYSAYTQGRIDYLEQRRHRVEALHARFGAPPLGEAGFTEWNALFEDGFRAGWRAFDDALEAVAQLRAARVGVGVVTNAATPYQRLKLDAVGLADLPVLVGVDLFGFGKPDPRVFAEGARRLGLEPGEAAYVGDELHADALGASRAGLTGVWLDRPGWRGRPVRPEEVDGAREEGVRRIESLRELSGALGLG